MLPNNENDRDKIIAFYLEKISSKQFEIDQVRKDLEKGGFGADEIGEIVKAIDNELQRRLLNPMRSKKVSRLSGIGVILSVLGVVVLFLSRMEVLQFGAHPLIDLIPLLAGLSFLFSEKVRPRSEKFGRH